MALLGDCFAIACRAADDWGPDRLNASQRRDLMEIVEDRSEVERRLRAVSSKRWWV
ncbi:hypothetical protein [Parasedimentitalea psychrophila]|uniref:hypothetical protein n=1 Tax=Parasedimentitalea psychrophila TaxID=2997337 RepID=UPI0022EB51D7|nr:hypothetical protein [Parasedimentitalea psychrophila]